MNKKGFTIVELIAVIGLLAIAATIFGINAIKLQNQNKELEYNTFLNTIYAASDAYITTFSDEFTTFPTTITIGNLKKTGFLNPTLKDPKTGELVNDTNKVKIEKDGQGAFVFTYPV